MNKQITFLLVLVFSVLTAQIVRADIADVPHIMTAPVVLYDEGGNVLADDTYDLTISIKDHLGTVLYTEEQTATVRNGIASILIGSGTAVGSNGVSPAGGISWDILAVDGDVSVTLLVEGQSTVQEVAILATQPYSFISSYALSVESDSITSSSIRDGSITADDLDATFLDELHSYDNSSVAVTPAVTSLDSSAITVTSDAGLNNSGGTNVKTVLQDLDSAIDSVRGIDIDQANSAINSVTDTVDEITTTTPGVEEGTTVTQIDDTAIPDTITPVAIDGVNSITMAADADGTIPALTLNGGSVSGVGAFTFDETLGSLDLNHQDISNVGNFTFYDANGSLDLNGGTIANVRSVSGDLTFTGNVTITGGTLVQTTEAGTTINYLNEDSSFSGDVSGTAGNIQLTTGSVGTSEIADGTISGDDLNFTGGTTSVDSRYVNVNGDTMTSNLNMGTNNISSTGTISAGTLSATNVSGNGSSLTNLNGSNISSGTVSASWIDTAMTTDTELATKVTKTGDSMTGTLTMSSGNIAMSSEATVDGVDVSALSNTVSQNTSDIIALQGGNPDPTYGTVTADTIIATTVTSEITTANTVTVSESAEMGAPPYTGPYGLIRAIPDPTAGTLYKNNMILAWARVSSHEGGDPYVTSGFNVEYTVTRMSGVADYSGCDYRIYFQRPATSADSYVVTGNITETADDVIMIRDTAATYFTVTTADASDSQGCSTTEDFHVMVVGY